MYIKLENFDIDRTANHIFDNATGLFCAQKTALYMDKFVPMDSGILAQTYEVEPFQVTYIQPYAHYLWNGVLMVGPSGSSYARFGEIKHYKDSKLKYSKTMHPNATSHWEQATQKAYGKQLAKDVTDYLRSK